MDEGEIYLEPDFKVVSEKVYVKIYSFEKDKIIYTGSNPLTNGDHPVSWNPKAHLLVLESRRSGWVNPEMIYEDCEKFKGKYNICVSNRPIRDVVLRTNSEVHTPNRYLLTSEIGEEECIQMHYLNEGDCLFIKIEDPIEQRKAEEQLKMWDEDTE